MGSEGPTHHENVVSFTGEDVEPWNCLELVSNCQYGRV